jgi:hypothetical protein
MGRAKNRGNGQGTLFKRSDSGSWIASWWTHDGRRREQSTGTTDRAAAERILRKHVADEALRKEGVIDAAQDRLAIEGRRPVAEHVADFEAYLEAKGNTAGHIEETIAAIENAIEASKATTIRDLDATRIYASIDALRTRKTRPIGARSFNKRLVALKAFGN